MGNPILSIRQATKQYGSFVALDHVDLDIEEGEFLTLLGPSGSGKTTLLSAIAGFNTVNAGSIQARGKDVTHLPPEKREFAMVFQGYALFPTMTVAENVGYPLRVRGWDKERKAKRVQECLAMVQMEAFAHRMPNQLSGGQQQRVALARALSFHPDVLLLDEPLSALDKKLRADLQWELKALHDKLGVTFIYVTHDQDEALSMSDRIIILKDGKIQQEGGPRDLYDQPRTRFVADFLGKSNFFDVAVSAQSGDDVACTLEGTSFTVPARGHSYTASATIAVRPERIRLATAGQDTFAGVVQQISFLGERCQIIVDHPVLGEVLISQSTWRDDVRPEPGLAVSFGWDADACVLLQDA